jgi:hypothetical protein
VSDISVSFVTFTDNHVADAARRLRVSEAELRRRLDDASRPMLDEVDRAFFAVAGVYPARRVKP